MATDPITLRGAAFEIRGPVAGDAAEETILAVYRQCEDFLALGPQPVASLDMVRQDLALSRADDGIFCLVYDAVGRPIAVVDFVPRGWQGRPEQAYIALLMIAAPYRGQGLGRQIVAVVEDEIARDREVTAILSGVQANNPAAIRFWLRNGYTITAGPALQADGTTAYDLRKDLRDRTP